MNTLASMFIVLVGCSWVHMMWKHRKVDDTDKSKKERSGLCIYVDHRTGVQYVGTEFGGLTPRVDADGRPITIAR